MTADGRVTVLHEFDGRDGSSPAAPLLAAIDGNLYGTTEMGGSSRNAGTVFRITTDGVFTVLHVFTDPDGSIPRAALIEGADGFLYGTTASGGLISSPPPSFGSGTIFRISTSGTLTTLHVFTGSDGTGGPSAPLVQSPDSSFYGTTRGDGTHPGAVFRLAPDGTLTVLHRFNDTPSGTIPNALTLASDGNFYGTTTNGGLSGFGVAYAMSPDGTFSVVHSFAGGSSDGAQPDATLIQGFDGALYSTTQAGGLWNNGTAFRITLSGVVTVMHSFGASGDVGSPVQLIQANDGDFYGAALGGAYGLGAIFHMTSAGDVVSEHNFEAGPDGANPNASLVQASDLNFYGTTLHGGRFDNGTVFRMTPDGTVTVLHDFAGAPDGAQPLANLIQANDGALYGTTLSGGNAGNWGTVFRMTLDGLVTILHSFSDGPDGARPYAPLIQAADGNLYGTTNGSFFSLGSGASFEVIRSDFGSAFGLIQGTDGYFYGVGSTVTHGDVFRMTSDGSVTALHNFDDFSQGAGPIGPLLQASDGNFYGMTGFGGALNYGTAFRVSTDGTFTLLHSFAGGHDGRRPAGGLVQALDGSLYGVTNLGGGVTAKSTNGGGTIFQLTLDGTETVLHAFGTPSSDGANPTAGLIQGLDGNLYGTTSGGGSLNGGTAFRLTLPDLVVSSLTVPSVAGAGATISLKDSTKNQGYSTCPSSTTQFFLSQDTILDPSDVLLGSRAVKQLPGGSSNSGSTAITVPAVAAGVYYVIAKADGPNDIVEGNESNNTLAKKILIGPDLTVTSISAPATVQVGTTIMISDVTSNQGGASDEVETVTGFYLSPTSTKLATPLGQRAVPVLAANTTDSGMISVTIPADTVPGTYYIVADADDTNVVAEASETNNKRGTKITITK